MRNLIVPLVLFSSMSLSIPLPRAVIFDLDDTIFLTTHRSLAALHDIGRELNIGNLMVLDLANVRYSCRETVQSLGLTREETERTCGITGQSTGEWGRRFFSGEYVKYDGVVPGAVEFVHRIASKLNAHIIYLTGRNEVTLGQATRRELAYYGLPGFTAGTLTRARIIFKRTNQHDHEYKRVQVRLLSRAFRISAAFDDNQDNVKMFRTELDAQIPVVHVDGNGPMRTLPAGVDAITTYLYNVRNSNRIVNQDQLSAIITKAAEW